MSGKSCITAFTSSSPRQPIDPVGQDSRACNACRRSATDFGCDLTKDVSVASPNTAGAICRQASQSMHVESTKKSPGTFSGTRFRGFAMTEPPLLHSTVTDSALTPRPFQPDDPVSCG